MTGASRDKLEAFFAALLSAAGVGICVVSWGYGFGSVSSPGPGLYPFFVGLAIAVCAALILAFDRPAAPVSSVPDAGAARTLVFMTVTFCFWIVAMPLLGYVIVSLVATYAFCKILGLEGWRKPLAVAGGTALFIYLLFDRWLYIDLPRGLLG